MPLDLRTLTDDEVPAFQGLLERAFGGDPDPDEIATWRPLIERDRTHGAWDGARIVGAAAAFTFDMTVPGGPVPAAGVTGVAVATDHRRRGVLTTLMREQLAAIADRAAEPFATLWASEPAIYGRYGYGVAGRRWNVTVAAHDPAFAGAPPPGRVRLVEPDEIRRLAPPVYDARRALVPGMVSRSDVRWANRLSDLPAHRQGASAQRLAVYEDAGEVRGYALYRVRGEWTDGRPKGEVRVKEVVALDAGAHAGLWRLLLGVDLMTSATWDNLPGDDPLWHRVRDLRAIRANVTDGVFVRLLDVPAALTRRSYATSGRVTFEVSDPFGGYAAGRWLLDATPEGATCVPTNGAADLALSAEELGAAYLGDTTLRALHGAGRVDEHAPGAVDRASALLAWPRAVWCAEIF